MTETEKELYELVCLLGMKQKKALLAFLKTIVPAKTAPSKEKAPLKKR